MPETQKNFPDFTNYYPPLPPKPSLSLQKNTPQPLSLSSEQITLEAIFVINQIKGLLRDKLLSSTDFPLDSNWEANILAHPQNIQPYIDAIRQAFYEIQKKRIAQKSN